MRRIIIWIWMATILPIIINAINIVITKQLIFIFGIEVILICGAIFFALIPLALTENIKWANSNPNIKSSIRRNENGNELDNGKSIKTS